MTVVWADPAGFAADWNWPRHLTMWALAGRPSESRFDSQVLEHELPDLPASERLLRGNYQFLLDGEDGVRNLDARTAVFYMATLNTPAMTAKMVGLGSQYAWGDRDSTGSYLDGARNYRLRIPPMPPSRTSGPSSRSTRRHAPNCRPGSPTRARTARRVSSHPTLMVPSTSTSGRNHRKASSRTGSRPFPAKAGSPSCASTAPSTPGSTRPGARRNRAGLTAAW
jgi:hypothetical protein